MLTKGKTMNIKFISFFLFLFCAPARLFSACTAAEAAVSYFYEPFPQQPGESVFQLGASFTLLPEPVVENEYPAPALDVQYKRGIASHISAVGSFSTNYFTNLLHAGLQYNLSSGCFSFGMAGHLGLFAGFISSEGQFDNNSAFATFFMPVLRLGYRFDKFSLSMSWASAYIFIGESKVSDFRAVGIKNRWNDLFCTLAVEQPFLKNSLVSIGFSLTFSRTPYQSWLLFNTIDQYLFVPEFFFAFQI
jgi:hypothetical protein